MPALIIILSIIAILVVSSIWQAKKKSNKALEALKENWGQPKQENFNFKLISAFHKNLPSESTTALASDIDLESLFEYADRTISKPGQQFLYSRLNSGLNEFQALKDLDQIVDAVNNDEAKRDLLCNELLKLSSTNAGYLHQLFQYEVRLAYHTLLKFYIHFAAIFWVAFLVYAIAFHNQFCFLLFLGLTVFNFYIHYTNKKKVLGFVSSLPQLKILINIATQISRVIQTARHNQALQAIETLRPLKRKLGILNIESTITKDPTDISYAVWELIKTVFLIEPRSFINAIDEVNKHREDIEQLFYYIAEIDMAISIKSLRDGLPYYSKPNFTNDYSQFEVQDLYHPLVTDCVANSITVTAHKGVLVTGSNMSGKTTFIRSLAINALLSQTLYTSLSKLYKAPILNICTSITITDDLKESKSYFQAEAKAIHEIIETVKGQNGKCLIIIDEIFRGTNTIERVAAAKAILSYITSFPNFVFVSTHDLELAELLAEGYDIYSFEEMVTDKRLMFDYKIKPGILKHKNAIAILKSMDFPKEVIDQATEVSTELANRYKL